MFTDGGDGDQLPKPNAISIASISVIVKESRGIGAVPGEGPRKGLGVRGEGRGK
jgi:hypothetical protein